MTAFAVSPLGAAAAAALRFRGLSSSPERPVELQAFSSLQDLRLDGVPLEYVQGMMLEICCCSFLRVHPLFFVGVGLQ